MNLKLLIVPLLLTCASCGPSEAEVELSELKAERQVERDAEQARLAAEEEEERRAQAERRRVRDEKLGDGLGGFIELHEGGFITGVRRVAAVASLREALELSAAEPALRLEPDQVGRSREIIEILQNTATGTVSVPANGKGSTGVSVKKGDLIRFSAVSGEWRAGKGSHWPANSGVGYPDYSPGFRDYRRCKRAAMGSLLASVKMGSGLIGGCHVAGESSLFDGVLVFRINDDSTSDNSGTLEVQFSVLKTSPEELERLATVASDVLGAVEYRSSERTPVAVSDSTPAADATSARRVGDCWETSIKKVEVIPDFRSTVYLADGTFLIAEGVPVAVPRQREGDRVRVCLDFEDKNCPVGSEPGRTYSVFDFAQEDRYTMSNSLRACGS